MAKDQKDIGNTAPINVHAWMADLRAHNAVIYWTDFLSCASVFWMLVLMASQGVFWLACALTVGSFSLYRMALFSHEISHFNAGVLPGFELAWNVLCGVPLLLPSYMLRLHVNHHSTISYGTPADPEYLPFATVPKLRNQFLLGCALVPIFFILRSMVFIPLACMNRKVNFYLRSRMTFMSMNNTYQPGSHQQLSKFDLVAESATSLWTWFLFVVTVAGVLSWHLIVVLLSCMLIANLLNGWRTLRAHRYESQGQSMDIKSQVLDSMTFTINGFWGELIYPVGQQFHATHHLLPYLPYHALPKAHQRLMTTTWVGQVDYLRTLESGKSINLE